MTDPQPQTVHVVSSGAYSDLRYLFAYTDRDDAKRAVDAGHGDDIHELALLPAGTLPRKVRVYTGHRDLGDGQAWYTDEEEYTWEAPGPVERVTDVPGHLMFIYGTDRDAVVAATEEWAAQRRAQRETSA